MEERLENLFCTREQIRIRQKNLEAESKSIIVSHKEWEGDIEKNILSNRLSEDGIKYLHLLQERKEINQILREVNDEIIYLNCEIACYRM